MDISEEFAMSKFASSADRNAALLDEIERLRGQLEAQKNEWLSWDEKRKELERDAARYRWLRKNQHPQVMHPTCYGMGNAMRDALDAAIDAAMKG